MGGLSRKSVFINNYRKENGIDPIIIDAGDTFFASAILANRNAEGDMLQAKGLLQGYEKIGCDALNVGGFDLAAGKDFLMSLSEGSSIPFISANLTDTNDNLLFPDFTIVENNGFKIGVTGVSDLIPDHIKDVKKRPYIEAANNVIAEMKSQVDFIVLLANVHRKNNEELSQNFPDADYIFVSRNTQRSRPETKQPEGGPYMYSSGNQGKYLTIVEIALNDPSQPIMDISAAKGKISSISRRLNKLQEKDPTKTIEDIYADKPNVLKLVGDYRKQLLKYESIMADAINTTKFHSVALSKTVGEDSEILAFVDETLATCSALRKKPIKAAKNIIKPKSGPIKKKFSIN